MQDILNWVAEHYGITVATILAGMFVLVLFIRKSSDTAKHTKMKQTGGKDSRNFQSGESMTVNFGDRDEKDET